MSQSTFATGLTKVNNTFLPMIESQLTGNGIKMEQYARQCVMNALGAINAVVESKGIDFSDNTFDKNNLTQILLSVASLQLNSAASPREVYFQIRNVSVKKKDSNNKDVTVWKKQIEMGIEGDGNDAILAKFGRDIKKVAPYWVVREHDKFEYPEYIGLDYKPPTWGPTGKGDIVRVVYPVIHTDNSIHFYISEREDVLKNMFAHLNNNLMNETFGIAESRFKANDEQKRKMNAKKAEIMDKAKGLGFAALDEPSLQQWFSPAWTDPHSRESMILRKMRNNTVKKIPKDFGNAFVELIHERATDEVYHTIQAEIEEHANTEPFDLDPLPDTAPREARQTSSVPEADDEDTPADHVSDNDNDEEPQDEDPLNFGQQPTAETQPAPKGKKAPF